MHTSMNSVTWIRLCSFFLLLVHTFWLVCCMIVLIIMYKYQKVGLVTYEAHKCYF